MFLRENITESSDALAEQPSGILQARDLIENPLIPQTNPHLHTLKVSEDTHQTARSALHLISERQTNPQNSLLLFWYREQRQRHLHLHCQG